MCWSVWYWNDTLPTFFGSYLPEQWKLKSCDLFAVEIDESRLKIEQVGKQVNELQRKVVPSFFDVVERKWW